RAVKIWVFLALFLVGLLWTLYTNHAWEDYYITYRASKNLATGVGLTFTAGERVHSFTSPLGTLLPALASVLTGNNSDDAALWIFRGFSLCAYAGAGVMLWTLCLRLHGSRLAAGALLVWYAIDTKIVDFSTNGMETGFMMLFLAWMLHALLIERPQRWLHLGLAGAGLMWTRPDSCVYIAALSVGTLLFAPAAAVPRGRLSLLKSLFAGGALAVVLYAPWVLWAWSYYGSPIPHTIVAKGLYHPTINLGNLPEVVWAFPSMLVAHVDMLATTFMPPYSSISGWPALPMYAAFWIACVVAVIWVLPGARRETRLASFAFCAGEFYLTTFVGFPVPWYVPTNTVFALLTLAGVVAQLDAPAVGWLRTRRGLAMALSGAFAAGALAITLLAAHQLRLQQALIERGERQEIGQWLRAHASSPRDTVMLEPLGYIGFYSNLKMLDFPGLSSPEVIAARKRAKLRGYPEVWSELIPDLKPDWLVLRPYEVAVVQQHNPAIFGHDYTLAKVFDVRPQVAAIPFIIGRGYLTNDACFEVYHRVTP
ncbi:MAG: hypothetical protein JSR48_01615, partial [Verrucomicrobia bacterium]|nr:hypothetical protein [Verrucomicrobiota bacterium]